MNLKSNWVVFLIIILYIFLAYCALNNLHLYTPDSARYYLWSQSLSSFEGFKDNSLPEPKKYVIHAPLYSVLLSPVAIIFPENIYALKFFTIILSATGLFLFYLLLSKFFNRIYAIAGTILLGINPLFFVLSTELLSDAPFLTSSIGLIIIFNYLIEEKNPSRYLQNSFGLLLAIIVLLREIGIVFMLGAIIYFIIQKENRMVLISIIIPLFFYLIWIFRNEFIIGNLEMPQFTNAKLFRYHLFTYPGDPFYLELIARIKNNVSFYYEKVLGLIFFPMYLTTQFDVVFRTTGIISEFDSIVKFLKVPVILITWFLCIFGFVKAMKNSRLHLFSFLSILFYTIILLIYPINDLRFLLFPLSILILYFLFGLYYLNGYIRFKNRWILNKYLLSALITLLVLPNLIWTGQFIDLSHRFRSDSFSLLKLLEKEKHPPSHFTKPLSLAGNWIKENSDKEITVIALWKDLACWISPRKLINLDLTHPIAEFDYKIRDYNVKYLVSHTDNLGINEFEIQMQRSNRYNFELVKQFGKLNIYKIREKKDSLISKETPFIDAVNNLFETNLDIAENILDSLYETNPLNSKIILYSGIAKSLSGKYKEADSRFQILKNFAQAGMFLDEINLHLRLNASIAGGRANRAQFPDLATRAAGSYWSIGYQKFAYNLLDSAIKTDSNFIPAHIFKLHFALKQNKIDDAIYSLKRISELDTVNQQIPVYKNLIELTEMLKKQKTSDGVVDLYLKIAKHYQYLGVYEDAIDNLLAALNYEQNNVEVLQSLADIYLLKRRYAPARKYLEKILILQPDNEQANDKLEKILVYF